MEDGIGLAEKMLALPGLRVLEVEESVGEVVVPNPFPSGGTAFSAGAGPLVRLQA